MTAESAIVSELPYRTGPTPRTRPEHLALVTTPDADYASEAGEAGGDDPLGYEPRSRRTFSTEYKLAIVEEYEDCAADGDKGELLRREGLTSTHVQEWRRARDAAFARAGLLPTRPSATAPRERWSPDASALAAAQQHIERLESELARARLVIDIQGRAHTLLGMVAESAELPTQE